MEDRDFAHSCGVCDVLGYVNDVSYFDLPSTITLSDQWAPSVIWTDDPPASVRQQLIIGISPHWTERLRGAIVE